MKKLSILIITMGLLSGCASMFGDNSRQVTIKSNVPASVYINGNNYGTTPAIVTLPNYIYNGQTIILKSPGYQDTVVQINPQFQWVGLWNLLNGFGFIIDAATGNMVKIDPADLNKEVNLSKSEANSQVTPTLNPIN